MTTHWVLTEEVNYYDQFGPYYVASWGQKPTVAKLIEVDNFGSTLIDMKVAEELLEKLEYQDTPNYGPWSSFQLLEVEEE